MQGLKFTLPARLKPGAKQTLSGTRQQLTGNNEFAGTDTIVIEMARSGDKLSGTFSERGDRGNGFDAAYGPLRLLTK